MTKHATGAAPVAVVLTGGTIGQRSGVDGSLPDTDAAFRLVARSLPPGVPFRCVRAMERDSPNIGAEDWSALARVVHQLISDGSSGAVVLHGTDTLAYTAAALAFALQGVDRPVVLTGSMLPGGDAGSDAGDNLASAAAVVTSAMPGVSVVFGSRTAGATADILSATRVLKVRTADRAAFRAVDDEPLGHVIQGQVVMSADLPAKPASRWCGPLVPASGFSEAVDLIKLSPFTSAARLSRLLAGLDGVVIEGFGSGHVRVDHLDVLRTFDGPIVISTQVVTDIERLGTYASDRRLTELPQVIRAGRMTTTAALVKLSWVLGQGLDVQEAMTTDLAGELSAKGRGDPPRRQR